MEKTCCFTGNRPKNFPWNYYDNPCRKKYLSDIAGIIEGLIEKGFNRFVSGGALGADLDVAETVLRARKKHKEIWLEMAIPCRNQCEKWDAREKLRYEAVLSKADRVTILSEHYTPDCMFVRNRYMVDKSELVVAFWNGNQSGGTFYTMDYAKRTRKSVVIYRL